MNCRYRCAGAFMLAATLLPDAAAAQIQLPPMPQVAPPSVQVRTLEVRDITLGSTEAGTVSIARITFKGFARGTDTVRAESVEFETVVGQFGARKIEIPAVMVTGFEVPTDLFQALTEGGQLKGDWPALLERSSLDELKIEAASDAQQGPPTVRANYAGITLSKLEKGFAASFRIDHATAATQQSDGTPAMTVDTGELLYQDINLVELVRFVSGGTPGESRPLVGRVSLANLNVAAEDTTISVKKIEQIGLDGRAPDLAAVPPEPGIVIPGRPAPASPRRIAQYARELARTLRVSRYALEGISIASPDFGKIEVAAISVGGLSGRGIEHFEVRGIDVSIPGVGGGKLERFALERLSFGALLDLVLDSTASGGAPNLDPEKLGDKTPHFGSLRFSRLELDTPAGPMSLGQTRFETDDPTAVWPEQMTLAFEDFKIDLSRAGSGKGHDQIVALGYREIAADAQIELRSRTRERTLSVENTRVLVDEAGRVDLGVKLSNIDIRALAGDPAALERAVEAAQFEEVSLRLSNLGLAERLYTQFGKSSGLSPEALRARFAADIKAQAAMLLGSALAPGSLEAIEAFIRSPGRIVARATPLAGQPPLTISQLKGLSGPNLLERITIGIAIPKD